MIKLGQNVYQKYIFLFYKNNRDTLIGQRGESLLKRIQHVY